MHILRQKKRTFVATISDENEEDSFSNVGFGTGIEFL